MTLTLPPTVTPTLDSDTDNTNDTHNYADNHTLTHLGVGVNFIRRVGGTVVNVAVCCSVLQCVAVCCTL